MLEKPDLQDEQIIACLTDEYGLPVNQITFLPIGADLNTAVYRIVSADGLPYFLKLRSGNFDGSNVTLAKFLGDQGIEQIIAPLPTRGGRLWASLGDFSAILYPFVDGRSGFEVELTNRHWRTLGSALKRVHTANIPAELLGHIPRVSYSTQWRESVRLFLEQAVENIVDDAVALELAAYLKQKRAEILELVNLAERLAPVVQARSQEFVLCHSDIHAGNVLIGANGSFHIVDWDDPVLAPKERDLMFIGAGIGGIWNEAREEALFYEGYGRIKVDPVALAYYRHERIIEDIAIFCRQILLSTDGGADREQALEYLKSNFLPGHTIDMARRSLP